MAKETFYTLNNILKNNADYNIIYGERSNGKTTSVLIYALEDYVNSGYKNQLGLIRRWEVDFSSTNGQNMFSAICSLGIIEKLTKDLFNSVYYYARKWYLCKYDSNGEKILQSEEPFAYGFSLTSEEHYKSTSYPMIKTILFDEFISRTSYLQDEFIKFQNLLSTIIRLRTDVKIFMCGNTINKFCPYFNEMGLKGIKRQKIGTIDVYRYGNDILKVAVEYSDFPSKKKASNKYFAFDNPKLNMITNGGWEIDIYPHLPCKYKPKDIYYQFYILFDGELLHGNIIIVNDIPFLYIHRKTTPIRDDTEWIVYQQNPDYRLNYRTNILKPYTKVDNYIKFLIDTEKIFYQDNEVGEIMNNYIKWCVQNK